MQAFQDIFISYGRRDSLEFAAQLNRRLVDRGFTVWFDYDDIPLGVDYQKQIDDGIERADNFLFIISPHSINSPYCGLELELALKHGKRIIPLLHVEKINYETWQERNPDNNKEVWANYQAKGLHDHFQNMHPVLRKINWIYVREGRDDLEAAFTGLLQIIDRHKHYVHQHTLLLTQALEWERQQKQTSYLLIGETRLQAEDWLEVRFTDSQPPCVPTDLHCEFITESRKNADNLMTAVFLSYAEEDRTTAEQIRNRLWREGFTVWMNMTDIPAGKDFQQVIDRGIEEADNLVYLLSFAAVASSWCQHELEYALSLHKRVIPVRVEAIALELIPLKLRDLQYIDLADNLQESDYQQDESQLLRILRQDAAYHENHKLLLTKALKWQGQQRNSTILLRGYNLWQAEAWLKLAKQNPSYPPLPLQETFIEESLRQPPGFLDVFISYSRADSGFARKLNDALQIQGKRTWFDQESIAAGTADFQREIYRGIESADTFLFILSPRSVSSPYCADEVEYAASLNKRFVTLLHQSIDPSILHPELAKVQWLDFNQHEGDFSANLGELLHILDTDIEHLHSHTRLLLRAIEWEDKGRKESLLLRGDDLEQAEQWINQNAGKEPKPTESQRTYITNSRSVEKANQQATQILKVATVKAKRRVWISGGISLLLAGMTGYTAWQAQIKAQVADVRLKTVTSREQFLSGEPFEAMLIALESGQDLKTHFRAGSADWNDLQQRVLGVLQQAANGISEKNTLEGHQDAVYSVGFSPDGQTIASASYDRTINLWDAATGRRLRTMKGHQDTIFSLSFSPDGQTIASGSADKTVKLWDAATGKLLKTLTGHQDAIRSLSFCPDGQTIASASYDKTINVWNVATGRRLKTLTGHQDAVYSVSVSSNGKMIASGGADKTIKVWDTATAKLLRTLTGHKAAIRSVSFSPDSQKIASGSEGATIQMWNAATGRRLHTLTGHQNTVFSLSFSPDGQTLASGSADKIIQVWDVATSRRMHTLTGHQNTVFSLGFSPDGQTIVSGSDDSTIKLWNVATSQPLQTLEGHQDIVRSLSFSLDGRMIASGSDDTAIQVWNATTGKPLSTLQGHQNTVFSVSFSPDAKTIASGSADKTIKLWNAATGQLLRTLEGHPDPVTSVSFSPDGKTIASGSFDKTIKLWDTSTDRLLRTLEGHQDVVVSVSFSPDGQTIASGSADKTIKLWDAATGQLRQTLEGHQDTVASTRFSPDGQKIASSSFDKTVKLWDVATGHLLQTLRAHQDWVNSVSFSPDGQTIASGSSDNTVKLWDAATGHLLHSLKGHQDAVNSVSFSPDGKTIASGSADNTIKLWVWDFERLMTLSCNWIQGYLMTHADDRRLCEGYRLPKP